MGLDVVSDIYVEGLIKQTTPIKRYVFSIQVEWKNGVTIQVYRTYKTIFGLQLKLLKLEEFLTYLKNEYAESRTGYLLPDKALFGKLGVKTQKKALNKMREVDEFLKSVIHLQRGISQCDHVLEFFRPLPEDMTFHYDKANDHNGYNVQETKGTRRMGYALNISEPILLEQYVAICDYTKNQDNGLSLKAGNIVEVITMGEHGWWFVDLDGDFGWVPASFLTPRDGEDEDHQVVEVFGEGEEEMCFALGSYKPSRDDEVALEVGQILQVKQKNVDGWWLVSCEKGTGWAPCMHLHVLASSRGYTRQLEREAVMNNMRNIFAITDRRTTWNPNNTISTARKVSIKRRPHHDAIPEESDDKPSYVNIEYNNNKKNVSDSSDEDSPSYVNCDFEKKKSAKRRSEKKDDVQQGPSYMNMAYHNKKDNARMRRRRDEDGDLVELDFSKIKTSEKSEPLKEEIKKENETEKKEPQEPRAATSDSGTTQEQLIDENPREKSENDALQTQDVKNSDDTEQSHMEANQVMTQRSESPVGGDIDVFLSIGDYTKDSDTEVNLQEGKSVQVLEQTDGGWWLVRTQSLSIGWAPSNFLEQITPEELKRRKALGLEPPDRPPLRPPKSSRVHKKALEICHERKFWSFVSKNGKNATCSINDDVNINYFSNGEVEQATNENRLVESRDRWECDETGTCKKETNTKL